MNTYWAGDSVYAYNQETFGPSGTLGRADTREAVLTRDLLAGLERLNPDLPAPAIEDAVRQLTVFDASRSMLQHNCDFYRLIRNGVPVEYRDTQGLQKSARARVIDFDNAPGSNRFLVVRELVLQGAPRAELQSPRRPSVFCQRAAAGFHRTEGGLQDHSRGVRTTTSRTT